MISTSDGVFKSHCSKYLKAKLLKFKDQVDYVESTLIEMGLTPEQFDLGRNDGYQFFEFKVGTSSEEKLSLLKSNYDRLVNSNTPLVMSMVPYVCEYCESLHICFYIKALSLDNPFRTGDLQHHLYYFKPQNINQTH